MKPLTDINCRLDAFCAAVRAMRNREFSLSIHVWPDRADALDALGQELQALAQWLNQRFSEFQLLQSVAAEISGGLFAENVLDRVYDAFLGLIPYDRIGCALLSDDGLTVRAIWERSTTPERMRMRRGYSAPLAGSSLESILLTGRPRILNDLEGYLVDHPASISTKLMLEEGIRSSLTCPLVSEGKPVGFLFFSSLAKNTYHDCHPEIFLQITALLSVLIEKSKLTQQIFELNQQLLETQHNLKQQSTHDALTGLLNRGAILEVLQQHLASGERKPQPLVVIMADVDFFKTVNDTHGHLAGDTVLQALASTISGCLRDGDLVGRYGGEEFLIVLSDIDLLAAAGIAERIRQQVLALVVPYANTSLSISLSQGVALAREGEESLDLLLARADAALYQAKRQGRNRVCLAD